MIFLSHKCGTRYVMREERTRSKSYMGMIMPNTITAKTVAAFLRDRVDGERGRELVNELAKEFGCSPQSARVAIQEAIDSGLIRLGQKMKLEARELVAA